MSYRDPISDIEQNVLTVIRDTKNCIMNVLAILNYTICSAATGLKTNPVLNWPVLCYDLLQLLLSEAYHAKYLR